MIRIPAVVQSIFVAIIKNTEFNLVILIHLCFQMIDINVINGEYCISNCAVQVIIGVLSPVVENRSVSRVIGIKKPINKIDNSGS